MKKSESFVVFEKHIAAIRALLKKRSHVETKHVKADIVRDYSKFESSVYGPLTRNGYFPDKMTDKYLVKSRFLDTYTGLLELESTLPNNALKIRLPIPKRVYSTKDGHLKRQYRRGRDLDNIFQVDFLEKFLVQLRERKRFVFFQEIVNQKEKQVEEKKPPRFLVRIEKPVPRPTTPGVEAPSLVR